MPEQVRLGLVAVGVILLFASAWWAGARLDGRKEWPKWWPQALRKRSR